MDRREAKEFQQQVRDTVTVNSLTGCWLWDGATSSVRYPVYKRGGKKLSVRRAAYEAWSKLAGDLPRLAVDQELRQRCANPQCVNPYHHLPSKGKKKRGRKPKRSKRRIKRCPK